MLAPPISKTKTKAAARPTNNWRPQGSTLVARSFQSGATEYADMLQRQICNQPMRTPLSERARNLTTNEPDGHAGHGRDRAAASSLTWDFSTIPIFPPDRADHTQPLAPTKSGVVPRLARDPDVSPPPVEHESPPVSSLAQLDAPAMMERDAEANSSLQVTSNFAGSNPTFKNGGPWVLCESPPFRLTARISVAPARANGDLTVGFMQALLGSTGPKGHYFDADDAPYMTAIVPFANLPLRDADPSGPFYGPEAQNTVNSPSVSVSMADAPPGGLLWTTPDKKGTLQQITGEDHFVTWLVTKSDETGKIVPLRYITWSVGWFAAVDQSQPSGTSFDVGKITDAGAGSGPMAPIRSGPVANDSKLPTQWEPSK